MSARLVRRARLGALSCLAAALGVQTPVAGQAPAGGSTAVASQPAPGRRTAPRELRFTVTDHGMQGPREVSAGHVVLHFDNRSSKPHQIALWLVPRGKTRDQELEAMRSTGRPPQGLTPAGGIGPLPAGRSGSLLMRLQPGQYLVYCQLNGSDGDPYFKHGVLATLDVVGAPNPDLPTEDSRGGVTMTDTRIQFAVSILRGDRRIMMDGIRRRTRIFRGPNSLQLESFGGPGHALVLLRSDDPAIMARYAAWLEGRVATMPELVSGVPAVPPGQRVFLRVTLEPGGHILLCANRHARTGLRGYQTGEFTQFAVR